MSPRDHRPTTPNTRKPLKAISQETGKKSQRSRVRLATTGARPKTVVYAKLGKIAQGEPNKNVMAQFARMQDSYVSLKYNGTTIQRPKIPRKIFIPPPRQGGTSTSNLTTETFSLDGVVVLAYVCKRVPKSPNPDPNLSWVV